MAKSKKLQSEAGYGGRLHKLSSRCKKGCGDDTLQERASEKKEWNKAVCSVCLECPHNAVLLLCSSYENGCRPYMCATSNRYSNCLEQYSKVCLQGSVGSRDLWSCPNAKSEASELVCPLCRGQVKGWTIVEAARRYLNAKKRACVQEECSFVGSYIEIRKHVKLEHPKACPRDVDPSHAEKWKKLERERDLSDVFSTITANMPGAIVLGDYVIEGNYDDDDDDDDDGYFDDAFFRFPAHGEGWNDSPFGLGEEYFSRLRVASRSTGRNISPIARPHARFLFARQTRRSRERRR